MKNILEWLENTAAQLPHAPAFETQGVAIFWQETLSIAQEMGTYLARRLPVHAPVAICADHDPIAVCAMLGVLYAGGYYTILDPAMPAARVKLILDTFAPQMLLCAPDDLEKWQQIASVPCVSLPEARETRAPERLQAIREAMIDTDLCYVLFTSGSTGVPKGVSIQHRAVIDFGTWAVKALRVDASCRFGNQAPLYFDNSVLELVCALASGACVHYIPRKYFMFPAKMCDYLRDNAINTLFWVPSALSHMANAGVVQPGALAQLQRVFFCGEVMPTRQLNVWRRALPGADYVNMYGPTEITDVCAYYRVDRAFSDDEELPIGFACDNTRILLLEGEICVAGTCLAAGYYHAPEKTAAAFVQNPLNPHVPERIYRTGDLGAYNARGELLFKGRRDQQIKRSGYRIELGEIECQLRACAGVEDGCCLFDTVKEAIVCFYMGEADPKTVKMHLRNTLPKYMLPDDYRRVDALPRTGNGKLDRVRLRQEI